MLKKFKPLIICAIISILGFIILLLFNRTIVVELKALENYQSLKTTITWINNLLGIILILQAGYFIIDFAKNYKNEAK